MGQRDKPPMAPSLMAQLESFGAFRRGMPVSEILARESNVVPFPRSPAQAKAAPKKPRFNPSEIQGVLPWWARD